MDGKTRKKNKYRMTLRKRKRRNWKLKEEALDRTL